MSGAFCGHLPLPRADPALGVGSGSPARQTAAIMERFEPLCETLAPDVVLVYGDVNSTVAAALVAAKLGITVGHVEAGLRSRDRTMPEELNRLVTDHLADLLFAPPPDAVENLRAESVAGPDILLGRRRLVALRLPPPAALPPLDSPLPHMGPQGLGS